MPLLRLHRDDLRALVGLTADALGIGAAFVEKDFWVADAGNGCAGRLSLKAGQISTYFIAATAVADGAERRF